MKKAVWAALIGVLALTGAARADDSGVAEEDVNRGAANIPGDIFHFLEIRHVELQDARAGLGELGGGLAHGADDVPAVGCVLPGKLEAQAAPGAGH